MARKPQKRTEVTRARILEAAREIAAEEHGLESLTAEAIAARADVAKGTVFAHYGDMDGLLSHLLLDSLRVLRQQASTDTDPAAILAAEGPVPAVTHRMMALVAVIAASQTSLRVFMRNIGATHGHCAPEFVEILDDLDKGLRTLLKHWQEDKSILPRIREDRSPEEMLDGLIAFMLHGAILLRSHQIESMDAIREKLTRHVEAFLLA